MCSGIEQPFTFYIYQKTKFVKKICSDNWVLTPEIIKDQQNCRRHPRSKASKSFPKDSISEPLAAYSCHFCFLHFGNRFRGFTDTSAPLLVRNLSVIKRRQKVCSTGLCCAVSTNGFSWFPASTVVFWKRKVGYLSWLLQQILNGTNTSFSWRVFWIMSSIIGTIWREKK